MARDPDKGKQKQPRKQQLPQKGSASWLHQSPDWPIYQVLLSEGWEKQDELATTLVARQSPRSGKIAVASFLVDLSCMGVKSAFVRICKSPEEYQRRVLRSLSEEQTLKPAELDLVAKIVAEGLAYAEKLGISPDPEYHQARLLLQGANPDACTVEVPLGGSEGKPHFIAGPYDDVEQIMANLTRTVGPEGFNYTIYQKEPMPMPDIGGLFGMQKK